MNKALADAPDGQISLTDPDARAMATSARNSGLVGGVPDLSINRKGVRGQTT